MLTGNLEFLISSLPHLQFTSAFEARERASTIFKTYTTQEDPVSLVDILNEESAKYLSNDKYELFNNIQLETIHSSEFLKSKYAVLSRFSKFNLNLKQQLQAYRAAQKKSSEINKTPENTLSLEAGNPLEQEIQIMALQWQEIEHLSMDHFTDFEALIAYKIKLLLLQRWWNFDVTLGHEKYKNLIQMRDDG